MRLFGLFGPNVEKMKVRKDVEGLIKALNYEQDAGVREAAAKALGMIGDARAVEPLIAALKEDDYTVRKAAALALGQIGDPRAVEPLRAILKASINSYNQLGMREATAEALGQIGDPRAMRQLFALLGDLDVGDLIEEVLIKIGTPAVEPLIAALEDEDWNVIVREGAVHALGQLDDPRAVEPLVAALKHSRSGVREAAAEALGQIGNVRAVAPLIAALKDDYSGVREAAALALGQIGDPRAVGPLIHALEDDDGSNVLLDVPRAAAEALGEIGDARAVEPLIATLDVPITDHSLEQVRKAAAEALAALYTSGQLEEEHRQIILAQRDRIVRKHKDRGSYPSDCESGYRHDDAGIGVSFPV